MAGNPTNFAEANAFQRGLRRFAAGGPGSWLFARSLHHIDRPVYRITGGRHTFASLVAGLPMVMLTTTGARSGQPRTVPLLALPTEQGLAVIASNFGQAHHPAWYHNLRANADATIATPGGPRRAVRAIEVSGEQREQIWRQGLGVYPGYSQYETRAAHRHITVFLLVPVEPA